MEGTRVRRLEERDIDAAIALTDLEGWGYTPADFRRLLALFPTGCFAAELDGRVVGVLTTTAYDRIAFLGAVIVSPDRRGKGVGKQMMLTALDRLHTSGVRTVRLNAYLHAVGFYEGLGFHGEYEVVRWSGPAVVGRSAGVRVVRVADLPALRRFDAPFFGADRGNLLTRLVDEFSDSFLVIERSSKLHGYIVGNVDGGSCEVGPWVVDPALTEVGRDLLDGLVAATSVTSIAFSGPSPNTKLLPFVAEAHLKEAFRTLRMRWGENAYPGNPTGIWALAGLEKG